MSDQRYYEVVAEELQRKSIRPGLWARAVAETGGEGDMARSLYIRLRVGELMQIEQADRTRYEAETERQKREQAVAKRQQRKAANSWLWLVVLIVSALVIGCVLFVCWAANFSK
jgi:hypothetical protein